MEFAINVVMAVLLLVFAALWYREGRIAHLSLFSQYSRLVLVFVALLGAITATDRYLVDVQGLTILPTPQLTIAFRLAILIILGGLLITAARLRRGGRVDKRK